MGTAGRIQLTDDGRVVLCCPPESDVLATAPIAGGPVAPKRTGRIKLCSLTCEDFNGTFRVPELCGETSNPALFMNLLCDKPYEEVAGLRAAGSATGVTLSRSGPTEGGPGLFQMGFGVLDREGNILFGANIVFATNFAGGRALVCEADPFPNQTADVLVPEEIPRAVLVRFSLILNGSNVTNVSGGTFGSPSDATFTFNLQ